MEIDAFDEVALRNYFLKYSISENQMWKEALEIYDSPKTAEE